MAMAIRSVDGVPAADGVRARLEPVDDLDRLGEAWCALERHSEPSFFRSWGWIGCWLRHLPAGRQPLAAITTKGAEIVGLGAFVPFRRRRHWIVPARALHLHECGEPALNSLFIEHNGLVAKRVHANVVWAAMLGLVGRDGGWDEVDLGGMERHTAELSIEAARARRCPVVVRAQKRAAHLDLAALRRSGGRFADALSRNTRHQLMRARGLYAAMGPLSLRAASSADEALAMLEQLKALHQRSRRRRGQPGCFATPIFETFHRALIRDRFRYGEIQLLRAAAGNQAIGYLYNFAYGDRIYAYQSGFDYAADGRLKPGLLTHALAIERAVREGYATYDFMAGENRLKASLASHWRDIVWLRVQRRSAAFWLERGLAGAKERWLGRRAAQARTARSDQTRRGRARSGRSQVLTPTETA